MSNIASIEKMLERRFKAVKSLLKSLEHLTREQQFSILTSNLPIERLEELARFQENRK